MIEEMKKSIDSIEEGFPFLQKEWPVLRVGWTMLFLFILAGVLGLFGFGLLSDRTLENEVAVVEYDRYLRHSTESKVIIRSKIPLADSSIYLNRDYLKQVKIDRVQPEPSAVALEGDRVRYKFESTDGGQVIFHIIPLTGNASQEMEIGIGGRNATFHQFIYF